MGGLDLPLALPASALGVDQYEERVGAWERADLRKDKQHWSNP